MVSFRKLFPVLALIAILATVGTASAQIQSCSASSTTPLVRAEGLTEQVGVITVTCQVGPQKAAQTGTFTVKANSGNFTNSLTDADGLTTATVTPIINGEPVAANTKNGVLTNATTLEFADVTLAIAADTTTVGVRIENVRINANAAGADGTTITMNVSASSLAAGSQQSLLLLSGTNVNVAAVKTGMTFSVVPSVGTSLAQCSATSTAPDAGTDPTATVSFKPGFAYAFRGTGATDEPRDPGAQFQGVRLQAKLAGIPANADVYVASGFAPEGSTSSATLVSPAAAEARYTKLTVTNGTATAVWRVDSVDTDTLQSAFTFGVVVVQKSGSVIGLGTMTATGNLAPIVTGTATADPTKALPTTDTTRDIVPRFADAGIAPVPFVTINACTTTLIFPYVASNTDWETGVVISNTSKDVELANGFLWGGTKDSTPATGGSCTIHYFGTGNPAAETTASVDPGAQAIFLLKAGGSATGQTGITAHETFTGYLVAQCNFLNAHGFAFMTNSVGQGGVGYEALVVPTPRGDEKTVQTESLGQ